MAHDPWDPERYGRFARERRQPFRDLCARVRPAAGMRVVDLGCGPGETTRLLHDRLGARDTLGLDTSTNMLARAAACAGGGLRFAQRDIAEFDDEAAWDLVFSNAALHWVDDHPTLFARLVRALRPGGQLALQFPANFRHPSHVVADTTAGEEPFATHLGGWRRTVPVLEPERYAEILFALGCTDQQVDVRIYGHRLDGVDDVLEWTRGTLLTDYERRLPADVYAAFLARYRTRLHEVLGSPAPYFYTYRRVLIWARRPPVAV
jgi:trans-aconitate 2-methyltransferase